MTLGRVAAIALVGVVVFAVAVELVLDRPWNIESYRAVGPDAVVVTTSSGWLDWTRVTSITETAGTVTIGMKSLRLPLPGTGGDATDFTVELASPLGQRTVIDGSTGLPVRLDTFHSAKGSPTPVPILGETRPPLPGASNACGGFHLKIVNDESGEITATINDTFSVTIPAGSSETLVEWLPPQKPLMPWAVVVSDSTGDAIGSQSFTSTADQRLTVSGGQMNSAPYDISQEGCH